MDFGNPKKLRLLTICILFRDLKRLEEEGGGGWQIVTDFVTRLMRPKYLLKKSDRRCTFTQLANKKYDSFTFSIRITFEQVSKQRLKVKKLNKTAIKCNLLTGFLTTYLKISAKLVYFLFKTPNFKLVYLRSVLSDWDSVSFIWKYLSNPTFNYDI